jgi:nucleoid-associated protein YgaU
MAAVVIPSEQLTIPRHLRSRLNGPGLRLVPGAAAPALARPAPALARPALSADRGPRARAIHLSQPAAVVARPAHRHLLVQVWVMRLALVAVAVFVGFAAMQIVAGADSAPGRSSTSILTPVAASADAAPASVHVVRPGDTLWSIAASVAPGRDLRPVVDELARRAGGATLQVGQRIDLDGLAG